LRWLRTAAGGPAPAPNAPTGGPRWRPSPPFRWAAPPSTDIGVKFADPAMTIGPRCACCRKSRGDRHGPWRHPERPWAPVPEVAVGRWEPWLGLKGRSPARPAPGLRAPAASWPRSNPWRAREKTGAAGARSGGHGPSPCGAGGGAGVQGLDHGWLMPLPSWALQRLEALFVAAGGSIRPPVPPSSAIELNRVLESVIHRSAMCCGPAGDPASSPGAPASGWWAQRVVWAQELVGAVAGRAAGEGSGGRKGLCLVGGVGPQPLDPRADEEAAAGDSLAMPRWYAWAGLISAASPVCGVAQLGVAPFGPRVGCWISGDEWWRPGLARGPAGQIWESTASCWLSLA